MPEIRATFIIFELSVVGSIMKYEIEEIERYISEYNKRSNINIRRIGVTSL